MKRIYDKDILFDWGQKADLQSVFSSTAIDFFGCLYEKGEFLSQPCEEAEYLQIVVSGTISIYHIREDGTRYSLAQGRDLSYWEIWNFINLLRPYFLLRP